MFILVSDAVVVAVVMFLQCSTTKIIIQLIVHTEIHIHITKLQKSEYSAKTLLTFWVSLFSNKILNNKNINIYLQIHFFVLILLVGAAVLHFNFLV